MALATPILQAIWIVDMLAKLRYVLNFSAPITNLFHTSSNDKPPTSKPVFMFANNKRGASPIDG
jgi:hypothetical protein